jgi:putative transcriptional regulator
MDKPKERNPDLVILGERIKKIRLEKGLTLKALAHSVRKDAQSISRVEMGNLNPTYLYLLEVCKGLDIEVSVLLKDLSITDSL